MIQPETGEKSSMRTGHETGRNAKQTDTTGSIKVILQAISFSRPPVPGPRHRTMPDLEDYLNLPYTVVLRRDEQGECVARIDELS